MKIGRNGATVKNVGEWPEKHGIPLETLRRDGGRGQQVEWVPAVLPTSYTLLSFLSVPFFRFIFSNFFRCFPDVFELYITVRKPSKRKECPFRLPRGTLVRCASSISRVRSGCDVPCLDRGWAFLHFRGLCASMFTWKEDVYKNPDPAHVRSTGLNLAETGLNQSL